MLKNQYVIKSIMITGLAILAFSCQSYDAKKEVETTGEKSMKQIPEIKKAICVLSPTMNNHVTGIITFTQTDNGVLVVADIQGLTEGKHGFHIHQYGDCSGEDGKTTGGHFNPLNKKHGAPGDVERHVGDLGNVIADASGKAHLEMEDHIIQLNGPNSIIGRAIIVHAGEDDFTTQPTGNAGARVASGVIGIAK